MGEFELYKQVMADQERRDAGGDCSVELSKLGSELSLSRPIYERLSAIDTTGADAATAWYLKRTLGDFERAGVALDADKRGHVQALNEEIAKVGEAFDTNIANARKVIKVKPEDSPACRRTSSTRTSRAMTAWSKSRPIIPITSR